MFTRRRDHPWPKWPLTRQVGLTWAIFGLVLVVIALVGARMIVTSALPLLATLSFPLDPLTSGVSAYILLTTGGMILFSLLLLFGVCAGVLVWGLRILSCDAQLGQRGQTVQGVITHHWAAHGYRSSWRCVAYRFSVIAPDGSQRDVTRAERNPQAYARFTPGDRVRVRYLPDKPEVCRLEMDDGLGRFQDSLICS